MPRRPRPLERGAITRGRLARDLLLAVRVLARGRHQVADLAAALGHGRRTAYRLLAALHAVGLEVERHREGRDVYLRLPRAEITDWLWERPAPLPAPRRRPTTRRGIRR